MICKINYIISHPGRPRKKKKFFHLEIQNPIMNKYPNNQQDYYGPLIQSNCVTCEEFQEIKIQPRVKSCINCSKEYAYCFCNEICYKVTPGSITSYNYEYLTCNKRKCDYLGVRCTACRRLCTIFATKEETKLFWGCKNENECHFFKQNVVDSLRNHIESCNSILSINVDVWCKLIFRYVDNLKFTDILNKSYKAGKLNDMSLNEIKNYFSNEGPEIASYIENEIINYTPITPTRNNRNKNQTTSTPVLPDMNIEELNQSFKILEKEIYQIKKSEKNFQENLVQFKTEIESKFQENSVKLKDDIEKKFEDHLLKFKTDIENKFDKFDVNFSKLFGKLNIDNPEENNDGFKVINENLKVLSDSVENNFKIINKSIVCLGKRMRESTDDDNGESTEGDVVDSNSTRGGRGGRGGRRGGRGVRGRGKKPRMK